MRKGTLSSKRVLLPCSELRLPIGQAWQHLGVLPVGYAMCILIAGLNT